MAMTVPTDPFSTLVAAAVLRETGYGRRRGPDWYRKYPVTGSSSRISMEWWASRQPACSAFLLAEQVRRFALDVAGDQHGGLLGSRQSHSRPVEDEGLHGFAAIFSDGDLSMVGIESQCLARFTTGE